MPKRKGFTAEVYQKEILKILSKEVFLSTSELCNKLKMGYDTGLKYLNMLLRKRKIKVKNIGDQQFWSLNITRGIFLVNVVGIVFNPKTKKILIGRREKDPYVKRLTWCFPGGSPSYNLPLEESLKRSIKRKTGLNVKVQKLIYARFYPEKKTIMSLYYWCLCEPVGGKERPGEKFVEIKWIKPTQITKYFTTSYHPIVLNFLRKLEKYGNA